MRMLFDLYYDFIAALYKNDIGNANVVYFIGKDSVLFCFFNF